MYDHIDGGQQNQPKLKEIHAWNVSKNIETEMPLPRIHWSFCAAYFRCTRRVCVCFARYCCCCCSLTVAYARHSRLVRIHSRMPMRERPLIFIQYWDSWHVHFSSDWLCIIREALQQKINKKRKNKQNNCLPMVYVCVTCICLVVTLHSLMLCADCRGAPKNSTMTRLLLVMAIE